MNPSLTYKTFSTGLIGLLGSAGLSVAAVFQADLEGTTAPGSVTQAGWTSIGVENAPNPVVPSVSTTAGSVSITVTAGGAGYFQGRAGGLATWGGITGTSWNDMVDDAVAARNGDGTVTISLGGLDDATEYSLTAWHNISATDSASFANGFYAITPSIAVGTLVGVAEAGTASNLTSNDVLTDASFDNSVIHFMPTGGSAEILLTSASSSQFLVLSGMQLDAVPEPASAMLLGLGGLAAMCRRRR